jgi:hypothetical protein
LLALGENAAQIGDSARERVQRPRAPVRSTGALALREATMEIGAHFMHVLRRNPTIVNAGM